MGAFEDWDMASVVAHQQRIKGLKNKANNSGNRIATENKKAIKSQPRVSKYHNEKVEYQGQKYDSKKEFNRAMELERLEHLGLIQNLQRQVEFELQPKFKFMGKTIRAINYVADFVYYDNGDKIVEDVKSPITRKNPVYKLKKKMLMYKYGIEIKEV